MNMKSRIFKKLYNRWMRFVFILGEINSKIIFTLLFFVVFGLYALPRKFFYIIKKESPRKTYWVKKRYIKPTIENLEKQF